LVEIPIRAGCPEFICDQCGQAKAKVFETSYDWQTSGKTRGEKQRARIGPTIPGHAVKRVIPKAWKKCGCNAGFSPGITLDPFFGTGTVGVVAHRLGLRYLGIELNPAYIRLAKKRLAEAGASLQSFCG
jgi:adenine-specific DNA methylase